MAFPDVDALGSAIASWWHMFTQATRSFKSHFCNLPKSFLLSRLVLGGRGDLEILAFLSAIYNLHFLQKLHNIFILSCADTLMFFQDILNSALV